MTSSRGDRQARPPAASGAGELPPAFLGSPPLGKNMEALRLLRRAQRSDSGSSLRRFSRRPVRVLSRKLLAPLFRRDTIAFPASASLFWGERMHVLVPEGLIYIRHGYYEVELTELLIHRLRDGMRFVDVGAHFGYFTLLGAHLVGNAGEVHAFEPIPRTFEILARNARRRPAVTVNPCALFSRDTPLELFDWGPRFAGYSSVAPPRLDARLAKSLNPTPLRVSAIALDHYAEAWDARPTFIKIDAESAEADVLEGMRETLRRLRPALAFEVGDFDLPDVLSSRDLIRRVEGFGYRAYSIVAGDLRPHTLKERYGPGTIVALPNRSH